MLLGLGKDGPLAPITQYFYIARRAGAAAAGQGRPLCPACSTSYVVDVMQVLLGLGKDAPLAPGTQYF